MSENMLQREWNNGYLSGSSMAYVDSLYEDYLKDPQSVSSEWQNVFAALPKVNGSSHDVSHRKIVEYFKNQKPNYTASVQAVNTQEAALANLIQAYRAFGHCAANIDPLDLTPRSLVMHLDPSYYGFTPTDLDKTYHVGDTFPQSSMRLKDIIAVLEQTYTGTMGIEYMYIPDEGIIHWFQERLEKEQEVLTTEKKCHILDALIAADGLERYLGTRFVGQKRFSLEGGDALIPMMRELVSLSGEKHVEEIVIGMAHRGRLNVLLNVLGKDPSALFQEFEGKTSSDRTGDVKYHLGFAADLKTASGEVVHVALAFNPSHLEIIAPVVEGAARSHLRKRHDLASKNKVLPVVIHGDAAIAGQGVVMETFSFSQARGFCTGGTIHIVVNNQIGFTTSNPNDARSTIYCTDIAKMVNAPVMHVNGEDPNAVIRAVKLAFEFRMRFKRDVVIDLVCYRRHGHNEADEPALTQPVMYEKIKSMRPLRETYADMLIQEGIISADAVEAQIEAYRGKLDQGVRVVEVDTNAARVAVDWSPYWNTSWDTPVKTAISKGTIDELFKQLDSLPAGFTPHGVVKRLLQEREKMAAGDSVMNWGFGEMMAYASLLMDGYDIRLCGQDAGRGTFTHRHAVLHDFNTDATYIPLENVAKNCDRSFEVIDSLLSEEAVLAFEYGYATSEPNSLVIWEAQFGDFANGAQVVIDQFISSGEQKWGRLCGLVMFLPHGYEGQGPEHSSARLERYMQLCAQHNMQVCTPTTPAQIFHLLRRQMIRSYRKPLIVMTPKSLLRHKLAVSTLKELTSGKFQNVIAEVDKINPSEVTRIILCGGKVYYDLLQKRRDDKLENVAIIRIEQIYPFPKAEVCEQLALYPKAKTVVWCQEEPKNQGVWYAAQHHFLDCLTDKQALFYAGRPAAASPAVGSPHLHASQQQALVEEALAAPFK